MIWGRKMGPEAVAAFAGRVGAQLLITGHQPQEAGYATVGDRMIILASDHNQGVFLPLSLEESYDLETAVSRVQKFVALDLPAEGTGEGEGRETNVMFAGRHGSV